MIYEFEEFRLDVQRRELLRGAGRVPLEPQVFDLLHFLIRNRDRVVSKDDLVANVWKGRIVSDSALTSRIAAARKALGDNAGRQAMIRTVARQGVRFVGDVAQAPMPAAPVAATAAPPSIAVLPFDNMGGDASQGFLADGIAEDIITALAHFPSLRVIARNSSFTYRGHAVDIKQVGRDLDVRYVLEGSLRSVGARMRVTGQLIDATNGVHVWAERYDRDALELFDVQDEITHAVTTSLVPAIGEAERARASRRAPVGLDAWTAYQRGMWHLAHGTAQSNAVAADCFRQAIDADPAFAGGYLGLSAVLSRSKGTQPQEEEMARKAVALAPGNGEARARLALALLARGEHDGALREARESLRLCAQLAAGHGALGVVLAYSGHAKEAIDALNACLKLDPRGPFLVNRLNQLALAHYLAGDWEDAARRAIDATRSFPGFPSPYRWGAAALGQLGRAREGAKMLQQAIALSPAEFDFQVKRRPPWFRPQDHELMIDGLRKAGWAE